MFSGDFPLPAQMKPGHQYRDTWQWQRLLTPLQHLPEVFAGSTLRVLETHLRQWHQSSRGAFSWTAPGRKTVGPSAKNEIAGRIVPFHAGMNLAEEVLQYLRNGLIDGTLFGESEISITAISRKLGARKGTVRTAIQKLSDHGLVTTVRSDSIAVRIPSLDDVTEAYLARRALGAIAVRAAARWRTEDKARVSRQLDVLRNCVARADLEMAHYADMDFQIALFDSSRLNRIPAMLELLTKQAFMHFAVIDGRYAFSPARILEHNAQLYEAINDADLRKATLLWHSKMDDGLRYVTHQINNLSQRRERSTQTSWQDGSAPRYKVEFPLS